MKKLLPIIAASLLFSCSPDIGPDEAAQQALTATNQKTAKITAETAGVALPDLCVIKYEVGTWDLSPIGVLRYGMSLVQETVTPRWGYQFNLPVGSLQWYGKYDCYIANKGSAPFVIEKATGQTVTFARSTFTIYPSMISLQGYENGKKVDSAKKKVSFSFSDGPKLLTAGPTSWFDSKYMWISAGYADVYNNPFPVPEINGRPKPGRYVLAITINGDHYWPESDYTNNTTLIGFTIDEAGVLTMDESNIELNKPKPVENLTATKTLKGRDKNITLQWQSEADKFLVYKEGVLIGQPTTNSFSDNIYKGFKQATYEVAAVNNIGESPKTTIQVSKF
ncbi:MAG TPA: hypothetical protein VFS36_06415 [Chitinophagaceae bacterium]|nr:hypothetical protein [Chitinophagaceae bacterium]